MVSPKTIQILFLLGKCRIGITYDWVHFLFVCPRHEEDGAVAYGEGECSNECLEFEPEAWDMSHTNC
jgi:hypothetical protein